MSYGYDAIGRRISKTTQSGTSTEFLYDGLNAAQETLSGTINPILVGLGVDERFARNDVIGRTYFLTDALNSTLALTDSGGTIQQQYSYDPYGNSTQSNTTSGFTNPYQYAGREADTAGLYYYRARYYSPTIGAFISEDPIGFGGGQSSFYAYADSNPVYNVDPDGLASNGGPWHPPDGVSLSCTNADPCPVLQAKMQLLMKMINSHQGWDWNNPSPRGGGRHAGEIADLWRAYANCQKIYARKCKDCPGSESSPSGNSVPSPSPAAKAAWMAAAGLFVWAVLSALETTVED